MFKMQKSAIPAFKTKLVLYVPNYTQKKLKGYTHLKWN